MSSSRFKNHGVLLLTFAMLLIVACHKKVAPPPPVTQAPPPVTPAPPPPAPTITLRANPTTIEGHCDERGSAEYNIGLGDRRANAAKEFLISQGVAANRINTVSYGKERPVCRDANEECYVRNRRAHFTPNP